MTFLTCANEVVNLPDSLQVLPGNGIQFTYGTNSLTVNFAGSGGGSVNSVSAGNLSPLFTSNVSNPTTSASITFTLLNAPSSTFLAGPSSGSGAPVYRILTGSDLAAALAAGTNVTLTQMGSNILISATGGSASGTVTSVGISGPTSLINWSNTPVTSSGTLTGTLTSQPSGTAFLGPVSGAAAAPTFRNIQGQDVSAILVAGTNVTITPSGNTLVFSASNPGGTVTSVGLSLPTNTFSTGASVTSSGNVVGTFVNQSVNTFFAAPSGGSAGTPGWRVITGNDLTLCILPSTGISILDAGSALYIASNATGGGSGTVSSVSVGNLSPIFTSNTSDQTTTPSTTFTLVQQPSSTFLAGASSGSLANPVYRYITGNDIYDSLTPGANVSLSLTNGVITITAEATGGGGGSVTQFTAGNLSPLLTTNVSNPTTTPSLTFSLVTQPSGLVYASPLTGAAGNPTFRQLGGQDVSGIFLGGTNITLTPSGSNITLSAAGSSNTNGTVTSVTVGNLSPLFTSTTNTPTTTPTTSFSQVTQTGNSLFASPSGGGSGNPTFRNLTGNDVASALINGTNTTVQNNGGTIQINVPSPSYPVTSVSNSDGTLTISPSTGAVVASIASSAALPGSPTTSTPSAGDNSTKIATTAFVNTLVSGATASTVTGAGNLSPLFTTSTGSHTISFSLSNAGAGTVFGNFGGSYRSTFLQCSWNSRSNIRSCAHRRGFGIQNCFGWNKYYCYSHRRYS